MPPKRAKGRRGQGEVPSAAPNEQPLVHMPPDVMVHVLSHLEQRERVLASEVCRVWRDFTLSPVLWSNLKLVLQSDDSEAASYSFLGWLLPRAGAVNALHIEVLESPNPGSEFVVGTMSNLSAALMAVAGSLRRLEVETAGVLVVSQWAAALAQLHTACFIAGELHVKQGLGKLPRLTDLEFGSNNAELIIEEGLGCMPPSVTHLSLEHCRLARLPPAIARLTQLRSLDLSQNTFEEEAGDELRMLAALTGLECLKLANCRMSQVPSELSALRRLRILHMGGNLEEEFEAQDSEAVEAALRPLRSLQVLVVSQCNMQLPDAVRRMSRLERLFVTSTPVTSLSQGTYCRCLRHLCLDWDVAFESVDMLQQCAALEMLTLARPHRTEAADVQEEESAAKLASTLLHHKTLKQVNVVAVQGRGLHLSIHTLRFVLALSKAAPRLRVELIDSWDSDLVRIPNLADMD